MIDLSELSREEIDRVRAYVRLAPVTDIVAAGRRRRQRRRPAALAVAAAVCVAAAGVLFAAWPAHRPPSGGSPARTIVLDGGALTIEAVDGVTPVYDEAYARAATAQVIWPSVNPTTRIVLARVWSNLEPKPSGFDGTVSPTSWSLAWVLLSTERPANECPAIAYPGATPAGPPGTAAVIVDATSGLASAYLPNHATCFGWIKPQLEPAEAMYSVPFQVDTQGTFTVQLPPCGIPFGATQGPTFLQDQIVPLASSAVQFTAAVPIGRCHASATTYRVKPPGVKAPYGHAPTGQMRRTSGGGIVIDP